MAVNTRWQAFAIHLSISFVIFLILLSIILLFWYPGPFIYLGGIEGIKIVAGVDLVLGPILTLMIYKKAKKSLKLDLSIIAAIQLSALIAGTWIVYTERPLVQVLSDDEIAVYTSKDFEMYNKPLSSLNEIAGATPKNIFLDLPEKATDVAKMKAFAEVIGEEPVTLRTDLYISANNEQIKQRVTLRVQNFEFNQPKNCYLLPIKSSHVTNTAKACYQIGKGIVGIVK